MPSIFFRENNSIMKCFALLALVLALLLPFDVSAQKGNSRSSSRSSSKSSSKSTSSKIRGTKKTRSSTVSSSKPRKSTVAGRDEHGRIKRSASAKNEFMKYSGYPKGRKGYVVDHIVPLECGGCRCSFQHAMADGAGSEDQGSD